MKDSIYLELILAANLGVMLKGVCSKTPDSFVII